MEPCTKCGRTMLELRQDLSVDALRGSAPLCPIPACPLVERVVGFRSVETRGRDLVGATPPAVFVGRYGYPKVRVGPLLAPDPGADPAALSDVAAWTGLGIAEVLALRARLVRGSAVAEVTRPAEGRVLDVARQVALASRPVDTEVTLAKDARFALAPALDGTAAPMGPGVEVVDARLTSSPSVPRRVDAAVGDPHAKAGDVMMEMYRAGVDTQHIQRVLSVGLLGEADRRRLVPTRWSITATDDTLGRGVAERVRLLQEVGEARVHFSELHGNRFFVMLLPGPWTFEMQEAWETAPGKVEVGSDAEGPRGRTSYVEEVAGAYYAARLSVLEHLETAAKRRASAVVVREITPDYWAPLGVWVIREGVKAALAAKGAAFDSVAAAWADVRAKARYGAAIPVPGTVDRLTKQRTLGDF